MTPINFDLLILNYNYSNSLIILFHSPDHAKHGVMNISEFLLKPRVSVLIENLWIIRIQIPFPSLTPKAGAGGTRQDLWTATKVVQPEKFMNDR